MANLSVNSFHGFLVAKGTISENNITSYTEFPHNYIKAETYKSTPNTREEIKAYRDENLRDLHRVTADGHKTPVSFTIRSIHLNDKKTIQNWFGVFNKERKISIIYWNDEDNKYKQNYFYVPDIEFKIKKITDTDIIYDEFEINLIEY